MRRTILIVDDNKLNRQMLGRILSVKYEVLAAENGTEAIEILHRSHENISAVLLDIFMPEMDGYEMLKYMRGDDTLSGMPVIVTTGSTGLEAEVKALSLGANDFITKPYNPDVILHRLWNTINLRETAAIANLAKWDDLTGLYSRKAFFIRAADMIAARKPGYYVMACFDINSFKTINDQYGTKKGDEILVQLAAVFRKEFEAEGGICCRVTADNFAVLYPKRLMGTKKLGSIRQRAALLDGSIRPITFSVGRYIIDDIKLPVSIMYDRAAMAGASVKGRFDMNVALYDESMRARLLHEQEVVTEMNDALSGGQFEVWFQPQYNHTSGAVMGSEALVRWRHPEKGMISPGEFIPVFERNGFIYEIDKFVWRYVCAMLRKWTDGGHDPLPVSVNISRYDLFREDLVDTVVGITEKFGIPAELLRLEITESAFAESTDIIISVVKKLIDRGFTVEIDDFGSGYSSLNTLKDVPASVLKLDMRFLENDRNSSRGGNILESIVRMAKWINMSVIAEGVETKKQADYLASIGCAYIQGYYYAKPMPAAEYERLVASSGKEHKMTALETVETLDNNAFWDPESMDTLIFNSYVGGACIFEYSNGRGEILRVNTKYIDELGFAGQKLDSFEMLDPGLYTDKENRKILRSCTKRAIETDEECFCEINMTGMPSREAACIRFALRVIAKAGKRRLLYCSVIDMTAQREAEQKELKIADQLRAIMDNMTGGVSAMTFGGGCLKIVFANNRYYEIFGYTKEQFESEVADTTDIIHPDDKERVVEEVTRIMKDKRPSVLKYRCVNRSGETVYVRRNASVTSISGVREEEVLLSVITDITKFALAENSLRETDEQLRFLNDTAHGLLAQPNIEEGINGVLKKLLKYFGASRAYIIEIDGGTNISNNTYEVCAEGVSPEKDNLQNVPLEAYSFWLDAFEKAGRINIEDVDSLDDARADERELLKSQGIKSLIAVPFSRDGKLMGFVGVDDPSRQKQRIDRLDAIGDYIAIMLTRRDLSQKIEREHKVQTELMNDMPGGFCRIRVYDGEKTELAYANDGFCQLVGMTRDEVFRLYGAGSAGGVHPDDLSAFLLAHREVEASGLVHTRYRMRHGNGGYIWVVVFGRLVTDESGNRWINAYYNDISQQVAVEDQQKELLENLPCGACLFEYCDGKLSGVYFNERYRKLVGRNFTNPTETSIMGSVHPDDRERLEREIREAIKSNNDVIGDIRIRYGRRGYRSYHVTGRAIDRGNGKYAVYTTYQPSANSQREYECLSPSVLKDVVESSQDLSFIKDKNLNYICCSGAFADMVGLDSKKSVAGMTDYDLFGDKALAEKYRADDKQLMESGKSLINMVEEIPSDDGLPHCSTTSKYLLYDNCGSVTGIYGVGRDTTEYRAEFRQLKLLTDSIPGGIATYEITKGKLRLVYFSDGYFANTGYTREEYSDLAKKDPLFLIAEEDRKVFSEQIAAIASGGDSFDFQCRVRNKRSGHRWQNLRGVVFDRRGGTVVANVVKFDITDQKNVEEQLRMREEQYHLALRHSGNVICRYDVADRSLNMTKDFSESLGLPEKMCDVPYSVVNLGKVSPESAGEYVNFYEGILNGNQEGTADFKTLTNTGWRWERAYFSTIFSDGGEPVYAVISFVDVTEQYETEKAHREALEKGRILQKKVQTDGMTGVFNKPAAEEMIKKRLSEKTGEACVMIIADLDNLKMINDTLGHPQGDRAISILANVLKTQFRKTDIVGRIGGDEFVVFVEGVQSKERIAGMMEAFFDNLSRFRIGEDNSVPVCASVGISTGGVGGTTFEELYVQADKALYHVKENGKSQFAIYSSSEKG